MTSTSKIGDSLKAARTRLGWTRETLAHHSGISWSAISQIESGRRRDVRLGTLSALAEALGVSVDYFPTHPRMTCSPPRFRTSRKGSTDPTPSWP